MCVAAAPKSDIGGVTSWACTAPHKRPAAVGYHSTGCTVDDMEGMDSTTYRRGISSEAPIRSSRPAGSRVVTLWGL